METARFLETFRTGVVLPASSGLKLVSTNQSTRRLNPKEHNQNFYYGFMGFCSKVSSSPADCNCKLTFGFIRAVEESHLRLRWLLKLPSSVKSNDTTDALASFLTAL
jgi:hypothetical protein